jgi:hypothetical protein
MFQLVKSRRLRWAVHMKGIVKRGIVLEFIFVHLLGNIHFKHREGIRR